MPVNIKCPKCGKLLPWEGNEWRPFCSERCKMYDLGAWVTEGYKIPGASDEDSVSGGYPPDEEDDK